MAPKKNADKKRKPVRFTIPDVKAAPPRALDQAKPNPLRAYPSAAELVHSPEWKEWLESTLRAVLAPAALAGAMGLAMSGCADMPGVDGLIGSEPAVAPTFYGTAPVVAQGDKPPAVVMSPLGAPTTPGIVIASPLPEDKVPTLPSLPTTPTLIEPCAIPTTTPHRLPGRAPIATPPIAPPMTRGGARPVHPVAPPTPPPPPILPSPNPPDIDGDIAVVHPEPVPMPGGLRPVMVDTEE